MKKLLIILLCLFPFISNATMMTDFTEDTTPTTDDIFWTTNAPGTTPADRKVTLGNLLLWMATQDWTVTGAWDMSGATVTLPASQSLTTPNLDTPTITLADDSTLTLPAAAPTADGLPLTVDMDGTSNFATGFSSISIGGFTASRNVEADGSGNLTSADTATTGTGAPVKANSPTFDDDITLGAAGVKLTGSNGALTILGLGDGQDEDVKIDLNTTANTITVSSPTSSATTVSFSALNLVTTGTIAGNIPIVSDADGRNIATSEISGHLHLATGTGTWMLPALAAANGTGWSMCIYSTTNDDVHLDTDGDAIRYNGAVKTAGKKLTISDAGAFICVVLTDYDSDVGRWTVLGTAKTITAEAD